MPILQIHTAKRRPTSSHQPKCPHTISPWWELVNSDSEQKFKNLNVRWRSFFPMREFAIFCNGNPPLWIHRWRSREELASMQWTRDLIVPKQVFIKAPPPKKGESHPRYMEAPGSVSHFITKWFFSLLHSSGVQCNLWIILNNAHL